MFGTVKMSGTVSQRPQWLSTFLLTQCIAALRQGIHARGLQRLAWDLCDLCLTYLAACTVSIIHSSSSCIVSMTAWAATISKTVGMQVPFSTLSVHAVACNRPDSHAAGEGASPQNPLQTFRTLLMTAWTQGMVLAQQTSPQGKTD